MNKRILIIKTGRTHEVIRERHGCFDDWMISALGIRREQAEVVHVHEGGLLPAQLDGIAGMVITGSPAMVSERLPWSEAVARWLAFQLVERRQPVPVIGICYGHQLLAHALGGRVDYNPRGREIGTVTLRATDALADDPLLGGLEFPLDAHVTHLQSVVDLPPGAVLLAKSAQEPHHAFRVGEHIWGVQFHPEFNDDIMRSYIEHLGSRMAEEGLDPLAVRATVRPAPAAGTVLRRFAQLSLAGRSAVTCDRLPAAGVHAVAASASR